jgi:Rrf2 family protein
MTNMEITCKTEYALLALLELTAHYYDSEPRQIRQIAAQQNIPDRYLEQLLAMLRRGGLVRSQRGARGGYLLAREPWKITLLEVVICIEGLDISNRPENTNRKTIESILVREVWQEACDAYFAILQKYNLQDLCNQRNARQQLNLMYYI